MTSIKDTAGSLPTMAASAAVEAVERAESEYECELMIEALKKELSAVRNHLAYLTHHLDSGSHFQPQQSDSAQLLHDREVEAASSRPPSKSSGTAVSGDGSNGGPLASCSGSQTTADNVESGTKTHGQRNKSIRKNIRSVGSTSEAEDKERDRHYLQVVDHAEKRSWEARKRCLVLMQTHIEQQLKGLQERSEKFQRKLARIKKRERAEKLKLKPPRFKSTGTDDTSFLAKVHQSTFYKIVGLEHELKVGGKLRTLTDMKEFWDHMLTPMATRSTSTTSPPSQQRLPSTSFLEEVEEDEEYSDSWAITALPQQRSFTPKRSHFQVRTLTPITPSTPESLRFIPMKVPQFKTVADILGTDKSKFNEMESESVCHPRSRELEIERRTLHHMYQQARAHEMVMQRLLPEVPCFKPQPLFTNEEREESKLLPATTKPHEEVPSNQETEQSCEDRPLSRQQEQTDAHTSLRTELPRFEVISTSPSQTPHSSGTATFDEDSENNKKSPTARRRDESRMDQIREPVLVPLTMDTAMNSFPVRESKRKSALWTNYLKVGRCS